MLAERLKARGDTVTIITRRSQPSAAMKGQQLATLTWDDLAQRPEQLAHVGAIVNLAGESINQRWTKAAKQRILNSRLEAAQGIQQFVRNRQARESSPITVINASGISIYGTSLTAQFDESSQAHLTDFLAEVVQQWEAAADKIPADRLVKLRIGVVLAAEGGAFSKMALPYKLFAGGPVGSGKQWLPWIHLEDMIRLILFCLDRPDIAGPVNAVAPNAVTNGEFGSALGKALGRPHWLPVPSIMMKAIFGELSVLLLQGQRAYPRKPLDAGFTFTHPTIDSALAQITGKNSRS